MARNNIALCRESWNALSNDMMNNDRNNKERENRKGKYQGGKMKKCGFLPIRILCSSELFVYVLSWEL